MIYNFNLGIGWASSGVEFAQKYRNTCFHKAGLPAKFIFTDLITTDNIEHYTRNMGFLDSEIIWLYSYFTDYPIAPTSYSRVDFEKKIESYFRSFLSEKEKEAKNDRFAGKFRERKIQRKKIKKSEKERKGCKCVQYFCDKFDIK